MWRCVPDARTTQNGARGGEARRTDSATGVSGVRLAHGAARADELPTTTAARGGRKKEKRDRPMKPRRLLLRTMREQ